MSSREPRGRTGFTVAELITVVAIIGILAALALDGKTHYNEW